MPTKKPKPEWGYKDNGPFPPPRLSLIYPDSVIDSIMSAADISVEHTGLFRQTLMIAAGQYLTNRHTLTDAPRLSNVHAALDELDKNCEKIARHLRGLDDGTRHPDTLDDETMARLHITAEKMPWDFNDPSKGVFFKGPNRFAHAIGVFKWFHMCIQATKKGTPIDKGANPKNLPLELWVLEMAAYWCDVLDREFTIDYHTNDKGIREPVTGAAIFLEGALRPLDESAIKSLETAAKKARTERNNRPSTRQ